MQSPVWDADVVHYITVTPPVEMEVKVSLRISKASSGAALIFKVILTDLTTGYRSVC